MPKRAASRQVDFVTKRPWVVPDSNRRRSEAKPPRPSASVARRLILAAAAAVPTGAVTLKLDTEKFNECLDSGRKAAAIQVDIQEGARVGVTGTPATFINGRLLSGNQPYSEIKEVVDDELQRNQAAK